MRQLQALTRIQEAANVCAFVQKRLAVPVSLPGSSVLFFRPSKPRSPAQLWAELPLPAQARYLTHERCEKLSCVSCQPQNFQQPLGNSCSTFRSYFPVFVLLRAAQMLKQCKIPDFSETVTNSCSEFGKILVFQRRAASLKRS